MLFGCARGPDVASPELPLRRVVVYRNGVGYFGRRGVFEVVEMNQQLALAIQRADPSEFERLARAQIGTYTIERNAHELVLTGETTISEAMTVVSGGAE